MPVVKPGSLTCMAEFSVAMLKSRVLLSVVANEAMKSRNLTVGQST